MELVILAHVTLNRVRSASTAGMVRHQEVHWVGEVLDGSSASLRELVIAIAVEHGESGQHLRAMWQVNAWDYTQHPGAVVFNVQGPNVQYGTPYAICYAHPALKVGERYFKLEEVAVDRDASRSTA